jgi:hypothetical protein
MSHNIRPTTTNVIITVINGVISVVLSYYLILKTVPIFKKDILDQELSYTDAHPQVRLRIRTICYKITIIYSDAHYIK